MTSIFTLDKSSGDLTQKVNLDELYEKKREYDLKQLELYNKILNRVHAKIKLTSRQEMDVPICWFIVPEVILGIPKYDHGACIGYIINKLMENGFRVKYIHPNLLLIGWKHFVPTYVRKEIQKKTGIEVDESGKPLPEYQEGGDMDYREIVIERDRAGKTDVEKKLSFDEMMMNKRNLDEGNKKQKKVYNDISNYKPSGKF